MGIFSLATELSSSAHRRLLIKVKEGKLWKALLKASLRESGTGNPPGKGGEETPGRGREGWKGGHRDTPMGEGTGERLGRGKGVTGMPTNREGTEETPGRGLGGRQGCDREPPTLGGCRKDPTKGENTRQSYQQGSPIGKRAERTPCRVRMLEETVSVTFPWQEKPQEGEACPDLLENEGETVTNPRPSQIYVTPRGLKYPTPEGREKI